jgi:YidC/Oxa1 family membrane protein insertase
MQQRNFIWFMVLSFLILVGWVWVQNKFWPAKPKGPKDDTTARQIDWRQYGPAARAVNLIANRGLPLAGVVEELRLGQDLWHTPPRPRVLARWDDLTETQRKIAALLPPPLPGTLGVLAALIPEKREELAAVKIPFGGKNYQLEGVLTTRGAGVERLTLTKFEAANWLGEPTSDKLDLIPEDFEVASFLMYHYPVTNGKIADNPSIALGRQVWKLESNKPIKEDDPLGPTQEVRFSTTVPDDNFKHLRIFKTYRLGPRDYHLTLILEIQDTRSAQEAAKAPPFRYQLAGAHGLPIEGIWYTPTFRDAMIGMVDAKNNRSLWRTKEEAQRISVKKGGEAVPSPEIGPGDNFLQYAAVVTQYFASAIVVDNVQPPVADGGGDMKNIIRWARPTLESEETRGTLKDVSEGRAVLAQPGGLETSYTLLPRVKRHIDDARIKINDRVVISFYKLDNGRRVATAIRHGETPRPYLDDITVRVNSEALELLPGQKAAHQFLLYHGPVKTRLLSQFGGDREVPSQLVDRYARTLHLETLTDYGRFGWWTDLLIAVTKLMHWLLHMLHFLVFGSYGLTIILLTVLVRGLMFPISRKQAYFSVKMQEIAPEMKKIKEKYPNDRKAQMEATQELYRKYHINPLGSCLPLLMQMPIFLGLYYALQESINFRLAGFLWIRNLAAPDMLLWWTERIPWISDPDNLGGMLYLGPFLNLLPLVAVALMIVQQKIMTPPPQDEQQEMQQKMMKYMMAFFGILFYKVASGLCIYFISSSLWGLAERRFLPKKQPALQTPGQTPAPSAGRAPPPPNGGRPARGKGQGPGKAGRPRRDGKEAKTNGTFQKFRDWWEEVLRQAKKK